MKKENFIYGIRPVIEALKSGKEIEKILIQKGLRGEGFQQLHSLIREMEIPIQFVPLEKLDRLTRQNHQGLLQPSPRSLIRKLRRSCHIPTSRVRCHW
jgi:23S rRNA (guanosine2251-2'-O)-methyltransferase